MNYKTGLVSVSFRDKTPREILEKMKEAGFFTLSGEVTYTAYPKAQKKYLICKRNTELSARLTVLISDSV